MKLNLSVKEITLVGLATAIMGIFSQLALPIPFTTVPLTLQTFGLVIISVVLGKKIGTLSILIWALLGTIGIPVFSGFSSGLGVLVGPNGGYIIGFIFMSFIIGYTSTSTNKNNILLFVGVYLGQAVQYTFGVIQLKIVLGLSLPNALLAGLYPFILKDIIMITVAVTLALSIKKSLGGVLMSNYKNKISSY